MEAIDSDIASCASSLSKYMNASTLIIPSPSPHIPAISPANPPEKAPNA